MSKPTRQEIIQKFRERQDKFVYYVMGLDVAAIGFTLSKTYDKKYFDLDDSFLGIAMIAWLFSIMAAFRWVQTEFRGMKLDMVQYDINDGVFEEQMKRQYGEEVSDEELLSHYKQFLIDRLQKDMEKELKRSEKDYRRKLMLFLVGIVFFILWRVMEVTETLK